MALRKLVPLHRRQIFPVQSDSQVKIELSCTWVVELDFLQILFLRVLVSFQNIFLIDESLLLRMARDPPHGAQTGLNVHISKKQNSNEGKTNISEYNGISTSMMKYSKINVSLGKKLLVWQILLASTAPYLIIDVEFGQVLTNFFGSLIHLLNLHLSSC